MEENLEPNTEVIKEISDKSNKPNYEGRKESITEKLNNVHENIPNSQNDSAPKVDLKKENATPGENISNSQNDSAPKADSKKENATPGQNIPNSQNDIAPKADLKNENTIPVKNIPNSQNDSAPKVDLKNENTIPVKNIPNSQNDSAPKVDLKKENTIPVKNIPKPKKELPIEKKPFQEFINDHLIPSLIDEINLRGLEINEINLQNTNRPIAGDKCWVINCEVKDTCNFWLCFEKEDISSFKSISLSKPNKKPSIIESFLIDEKKITLKLIISRVLQRLNGQKLIGVN